MATLRARPPCPCDLCSRASGAAEPICSLIASAVCEPRSSRLATSTDGRVKRFVDVEHITTDEVIDIYTYAGGRLRLGGTFAAYGEEYGIVFGITCSAHGIEHFVTQHKFELQPSSPRHWTRQDTVYVWRGAALRLYARGPVKPIAGIPRGRSPAFNAATPPPRSAGDRWSGGSRWAAIGTLPGGTYPRAPGRFLDRVSRLMDHQTLGGSRG